MELGAGEAGWFPRPKLAEPLEIVDAPLLHAPMLAMVAALLVVLGIALAAASLASFGVYSAVTRIPVREVFGLNKPRDARSPQ